MRLNMWSVARVDQPWLDEKFPDEPRHHRWIVSNAHLDRLDSYALSFGPGQWLKAVQWAHRMASTVGTHCHCGEPFNAYALSAAIHNGCRGTSKELALSNDVPAGHSGPPVHGESVFA